MIEYLQIILKIGFQLVYRIKILLNKIYKLI